MIKLIEMDENVMLSAQMEENVGPVILINKFNVKPEDVDQLLKAWTADATYFKQQPGFISTQLHRGIAGSCVFINLSTMQFGNLLSILNRHLTGLISDPSWENILIAQLRLRIFLRRLQYRGFVLTNSILAAS